MVWTVITIAYRRVLHAPTELMLTFVVPIVFFSIFAMIFGSGIGRTPSVRTLLVDADQTEVSATIVEQLSNAAGLKSTTYDEAAKNPADEARRLIQEGQYSAAVVLPAGFTAAAEADDTLPRIEILSDSSNQVAAQVVGAVVQQSVMTTLAAARQQRIARQRAAAMVPASTGEGLPSSGAGSQSGIAVMAAAASNFGSGEFVEVIDVLGDGRSNPLIAMSAAGIAVMFLLFSSAGSGGSLLEEEEAGTLERMLTSQLTMSQLLLGKWLYILLQGVVQIFVMFVWGHFVFGVDLFAHLPGFFVMTIATSAAAASFALVLATACRSRSQLNGVSTILILTMSALGGSMVPRYVMSAEMQQWGLITFNAWALDGYNKVFWRDLPVVSLTPQVYFLGSCSFALLIIARFLARRWESV